MKELIFIAISLVFVGCVTEPEVKTQDHTFGCIYMEEYHNDSLVVVPYCNMDKVK